MYEISKSKLFINCSLFILDLWFFSISLNAQWIENFDHDLSYWKGDTSHFNITVDHQLMLNANAAGTSFIFRPFEYQSVDQVWTIF